MEPTSPGDLWAAVHAERARLAEDLACLDDAQWAEPSLCGRWTVEDVVAHLTAAASIGRLRWLRSVLGARFDFDRHNQRRLEEHRGATPAETLQRFRAVVGNTVAPSKDTAAWLGEVVVHGQDIRRPLGLPRTPPVETVTAVARFHVGKDFAVPSRSAAQGLHLVATDGPFEYGSGPLVSGTTLAIVMAMAGREPYCDDLTGEGLSILRSRCSPA
ncbi:maleylpyruvate isomerase family mycothiol-dependent enzyme [uncultured Kocuria sp.]|uniref:maleylpyruvate isomerase family mycothiol-dependent enzyme n=1 Tax=uncultured Kocuria sp. TaxID=259305 RepID=UPI00261D2E15|nr:maleylpyruvate isomerase family mycothiol-dependent enzyme [uncultured Kocuria sp.]